jgi:hypothetical protein
MDGGDLDVGLVLAGQVIEAARRFGEQYSATRTAASASTNDNANVEIDQRHGGDSRTFRPARVRRQQRGERNLPIGGGQPVGEIADRVAAAALLHVWPLSASRPASTSRSSIRQWRVASRRRSPSSLGPAISGPCGRRWWWSRRVRRWR